MNANKVFETPPLMVEIPNIESSDFKTAKELLIISLEEHTQQLIAGISSAEKTNTAITQLLNELAENLILIQLVRDLQE